jgi:subtilisin family serine protease
MNRLSTWFFVALAFSVASASQVEAQPTAQLRKIGPQLKRAASAPGGWSRAIVRAVDRESLAELNRRIPELGGTLGRPLPIINARAAFIPNRIIPLLAANPRVASLSADRVVVGSMERTGAAVGAAAVRHELGYDGSGVGVAVIDSGATPLHDDLAGDGGASRIASFVDFVDGRVPAHDAYGHGTHVAGIIAGNGFDSAGARTGIAPRAHLVVLRVLDGQGRGRISDVIAALDYVVANRARLNIRVVNLSIASGVYESYNSDPLTLAARHAVAAGVVVVAAAGNGGRSPEGFTQYGGITAPGNAPWVLTVGGSSHNGTAERTDDTIAPFSSRGPSAVDYSAKPDLVAPGVGIASLSAPESSFYTSHSAYLLAGTAPTTYLPYLSLSGTSMATPVVSGTVALMLQANPALTPNQVKAILQYTAEASAGIDVLTQGAGFLNARGAVHLASFFAAPSVAYPAAPEWGGRLIWGTQVVRGGRLMPDSNAWSPDLEWGAPITHAGQNVEWGVICETSGCDGEGVSGTPWRTICADPACASFGTSGGEVSNAVWGSACGGADCTGVWNTSALGGAVATTSDRDDTVVWGTTGGDTVVWGTNEGSSDTVVWGTNCADPACAPVIWNRQ